ncbi:MAG: hypothetical protein RR461_08155, partial [Angelakisella sp.]
DQLSQQIQRDVKEAKRLTEANDVSVFIQYHNREKEHTVMAKNNEYKVTGKDAAKPEAKGNAKGLTAHQKKTLVVALVIVIVVVVSIMVDNSVRNPRTTSEEDAMNQIFGQDVIANNSEITYDTPVEIVTYPPAKINGKEYWQVDVIAGDEPNTKLFGPYYVAASNSKIYLKDAAGQLIPFGV